MLMLYPLLWILQKTRDTTWGYIKWIKEFPSKKTQLQITTNQTLVFHRVKPGIIRGAPSLSKNVGQNQLVMSIGEVQGSRAEDGGACWAGGNLMLGTKHQLPGTRKTNHL